MLSNCTASALSAESIFIAVSNLDNKCNPDPVIDIGVHR